MALLLISGADIIGVNCRFDPTTSIKTISLMKEALSSVGKQNQPTFDGKKMEKNREKDGE